MSRRTHDGGPSLGWGVLALLVLDVLVTAGKVLHAAVGQAVIAAGIALGAYLLGRWSGRRSARIALPELEAYGAGPLVDPDCRDGKHGICIGEPCECPCHRPGEVSARHG